MEQRWFTPDDVNFLQAVANMLAAAIQRKRVEEDIHRLALQDPLTGLPNRALFRDHLWQALARVKRSGGLLAVLLLDLDYFKDVNDTLGHPTGDRLLGETAARLQACVRATDPPARLGGDEFAIILTDLLHPEDAAAVAGKIIAKLAEPFRLDGHEIHVGASVGITICPTDGEDPDGLLRNADLALYRAKAEGRNTYQFYAADMAARVERRKMLEHDLRRALDRGELELHYQPQVNLADGCITGAEALLRWRHPSLGPLFPDEFIPIAEASGLVVPLGIWVLREVCAQAREWREAGLPPIVTAVNLSLAQCRRGDIAATVAAVVEECGWDHYWLELEVTERVFLPPEEKGCLESLWRLRRQGTRVSIDDFGTGYSSLGRLRSLPVDKVKVDRSFVAGLGSDPNAEQIVRAVIGLGRSLGLSVVAEGVERATQLAFLKAEGCHSAQGYHLSPPLPADDFAVLLGRQGHRLRILSNAAKPAS